MREFLPSNRLTSPRILVMGFTAIIVLGTLLLLIPAATTQGISVVDAVFTSTSAVCVTGLIVKDTPTDFTPFGKGILLFLIQIGGLGYMSLATLMTLMAGRRIGITQRMLIRESWNVGTMEGLVSFLKRLLLFTVTMEVLGTLLLTVGFWEGAGSLMEALVLGLFHSVSAFNNAGFSLFSDSLIGYRHSPLVLGTIMALVVFGGIGFVVMEDLQQKLRGGRRLMTHTRIVLWTSGVLAAAGAVLFYVSERRSLFAVSGQGTLDNMLTSLFASVTARTAGFNSVDYGLLEHPALYLTIILMLIGASPGSTGGGIKTTTFSVVMLHIWNTARGRRETAVFGRRIGEDVVARALVILALAVIYVNLMTLVIVDIEYTPFIKTLFEVVSAFGTVGLSVGDGGVHSFCAQFSGVSKLLLVVTMLAGRLGPLTLFAALVSTQESRIRYPEGKVMIG